MTAERRATADVVDRLPHGRQLQRSRGHRPGGVPAPPRGRRRRVAEGVAVDRGDAPEPSTTCGPRACGGSSTRAPGCRSRCVADPAPDAAVRAESLSLAVLVLLESLTPGRACGVRAARGVRLSATTRSRAIVDKSQDNVRQLAVRAAATSTSGGRASSRRASSATSWCSASSPRCSEGDTEPLVELLAEDATFYGDGGGKAPQLWAPVAGAGGDRPHARGASSGCAVRRGYALRLAEVNGEPGPARLRRRRHARSPLRRCEISGGRDPGDPLDREPGQAGSHLEHDLAELAAGLEALVGRRGLVERVGRGDRTPTGRRTRSRGSTFRSTSARVDRLLLQRPRAQRRAVACRRACPSARAG